MPISLQLGLKRSSNPPLKHLDSAIRAHIIQAFHLLDTPITCTLPDPFSNPQNATHILRHACIESPYAHDGPRLVR